MNAKLLTLCCVSILLIFTPASSQVTGYEDTVSDFQGSSLGDGAVTIGGYHSKADGGGGVVTVGPSAGCSPANNGTIFKDSSGNCYYRVNATNDVREWGAFCDVVALGNTPTPNPPWGPILWNGSDFDGTKTGAIEIPAKYFNPSPSTSYALPQPPANGIFEFITATQIGPVEPTGTNPAVWADRWSQVATSSSSFSAGDLLSFAGPTTSGQFSQQIAISVDQIQDTSGNILPPSTTGKIYKWHFVWGGQYTSLPDATMSLDTSHSYISHGASGAAASFMPAWSGWSVMDHGTNIDTSVTTSMNYTVGSTVTFDFAGSVSNQGHLPKILVMAVSAGQITGWQWLDYGSYAIAPASASCSFTSSCSGAILVPSKI